MPKEPKVMHTLVFPIYQVDGYGRPREAFDSSFRLLGHVHNVLVKEASRRLDRLYRNKEYRYLLRQYHKASGDREKRKIGRQLDRLVKQYGLKGKFFLQKYASVQQHMYRKHFSTHQIQKEGEAIYRGVEKVLYEDGRHLHYKKWSQVRSISQKERTNGVKFNIHTGIGKWGQYTFRCHIDHLDEYKATSLAFDDISYFEIKRQMFDSGWRYYLVIVFKGTAPRKIPSSKMEDANRSAGGIDLGTSTIAYVNENTAILERLAPDVVQYERKIRHLQKLYDRLQRINNPENYNSDGTIRKGRKRWYSSRRMKALQRQMLTLHRRKTAYIRMCHNMLANRIIRSSSHIYYEKNRFSSLQKRAKKAERSDRLSSIRKKDGTTIQIRKYKKKKRFGHSLNVHAPASFVTILKNKCVQYEIPFEEIHTQTYRASQYNPLSGEYRKAPLSQRMKDIGRHKVQRDLLSAYLIAHPDSELSSVDAQAVYDRFPRFLKVHDACISRMKTQGISFRQCFGF